MNISSAVGRPDEQRSGARGTKCRGAACHEPPRAASGKKSCTGGHPSFETLGFESYTAPQVAVFFGLILGALFGILAERTKFCFRRGLVGEDARSARGVWLTGFAAALIGTQLAASMGWVAFDSHRYHAAALPVLAIVAGGLMFGAGMVLTRGCISRLTVLTATGNLRALTVLAVFAIAAHATLKGVLAPVRTSLGAYSVDLGSATGFAALPGGALVWTALIAAVALAVALRSGGRPVLLAQAAALGLLVAAGWVGTGWVLYDDFDPIAMESLSFTSPMADSLFWTVASTAVPATFGTGLVGGVLVGALVSALASRRFRWQSFSSPRETGRYLVGALLMGTGGVLAGGCTVGAGLSGTATLSFAAFLALGAIAVGGLATNAALQPRGALQPAE
ncbi:YeeE/YedE family protein [Salipiger mucosus]|uniref:Lipocalin-related protein and Bos/Can/Equ allergen n=1 Tax=Salipiger mucosus DSM 16094 TaxID=1123237 RepID=S9QZ90_9RHOB|nr:YeeE/YedE family protein [Salipiger mucosus]EPX84983.1 Lipocalin-related protein and Bos/Can/Equ allergen [Salipiger mucosus DSM 16094]